MGRHPTRAHGSAPPDDRTCSGARRGGRCLRRPGRGDAAGAPPGSLLLLQRRVVGARCVAAGALGATFEERRHTHTREGATFGQPEGRGAGSRRGTGGSATRGAGGHAYVGLGGRRPMVGDSRPAARLRAPAPGTTAPDVSTGGRARAASLRTPTCPARPWRTPGGWAGPCGTVASTAPSAGPATPAATAPTCGASPIRTPPWCCSPTAPARSSGRPAAAPCSMLSWPTCWTCSACRPWVHLGDLRGVTMRRWSGTTVPSP